MPVKRAALLLTLASLLLLPSATPAASQDEVTLTLQQGMAGYLGGQTTYIYQYAPDTNYCSDSGFRVGFKQQYAALARFDLSSIPADATITRATLELYAYGWSGADITLGAYVITRTTSLCQSTWNRPRTAALWGIPGANDLTSDRRPGPLGTARTSGIHKWYGLDVTSAAQSWLSGALANNGVLLRQTVFTPDSVSFASSTASELSRRPRLVVAYRSGSQPGATATSSPTPTPASGPSAMPTLTLTVVPGSTPTRTATATGTVSGTPTRSPTPSPTSAAGNGNLTVELQQGSSGYVGSKTTCLYQYSADSNYCLSSALKVGSKQQYATLARFDLSPIPSNATVSEATLQFYAIGWSGADVSIGAYVVTRTTALCQATWNRSQSSTQWRIPGANDASSDRRPGPASALTTSGIRKWYSFELTPIVQAWLSGSLANNGMLLRQTASSSQHVVLFVGNGSAEGALRPKLVITYRYDGPASTPTPETLVIGHVSDVHVDLGPLQSERVRTAVRTVSQLARVIAVTGDCAHHGTASETQEFVQIMTGEATIPWKAVSGNHDSASSYQAYVGPLEWSWDVGSYRLIGINTELIDYSALDAALTDEKPCIVLGHYPLEHCTPEDQAALRERFRVFHVPLYLAGHTHIAAEEVDPVSGTLLITGADVASGYYRVVTVSGQIVQ